MIEIKTSKIRNCAVTVPGSKSYTHRCLIAAALSDGVCELENCLHSEDTHLTRQALTQMGVRFDESNGTTTVYGTGGRLTACHDPLFLGNSGTSMRLLTAVAALGEGPYILTGTERMQQRPIGDLLDGLNRIGVSARSLNQKGFPPLSVDGRDITGGHIDLKCGLSSQFLSALLLIGPYIKEGLDISVVEGPVSKPYIDLTVSIMERFGVELDRNRYARFRVVGGQCYHAGRYVVEADASQASYFWAAAAVTGATVKVLGMSRASGQGDIRFLEVLEAMGCRVDHESDGISVTGGRLVSVEVDMADMPDVVPTLAVVAAFARGTTVIRNVAHLKAKESDRLAVVAGNLARMGIVAMDDHVGLTVMGGRPTGARIDPANDHRMAMSFAVAGLVTPGVIIEDETCVEKSFPDFWRVFETLYGP
ncbi:MAG: 3-phosphoshikimate 1-carboxyvinyltransferase [Thermodesulfobacteriota bacterium]